MSVKSNNKYNISQLKNLCEEYKKKCETRVIKLPSVSSLYAYISINNKQKIIMNNDLLRTWRTTTTNKTYQRNYIRIMLMREWIKYELTSKLKANDINRHKILQTNFINEWSIQWIIANKLGQNNLENSKKYIFMSYKNESDANLNET